MEGRRLTAVPTDSSGAFGMIGPVRDGCAVEDLVVGILGGTGPQGRGLAVRSAAAGQPNLLGFRNAERAAEVTAEVATRAATAAAGGEVSVTGGSNVDVAGAADPVIVAAPGMRGIYAGRLRNARQVEALTIDLVSVNRRYQAHAGIRGADV